MLSQGWHRMRVASTQPCSLWCLINKPKLQLQGEFALKTGLKEINAGKIHRKEGCISSELSGRIICTCSTSYFI